MTALTKSHRQVIEAWTGPIPAGDEVDVQALVTDLGSEYAAALQMLMRTRAELSLAPTRVSASGDTVDHTANLKAVQGQIDTLVGSIVGDTDISLTGAGEKLLNSARGQTLQKTSSIPMVSRNPRRGG